MVNYIVAELIYIIRPHVIRSDLFCKQESKRNINYRKTIAHPCGLSDSGPIYCLWGSVIYLQIGLNLAFLYILTGLIKFFNSSFPPIIWLQLSQLMFPIFLPTSCLRAITNWNPTAQTLTGVLSCPVSKEALQLAMDAGQPSCLELCWVGRSGSSLENCIVHALLWERTMTATVKPMSSSQTFEPQTRKSSDCYCCPRSTSQEYSKANSEKSSQLAAVLPGSNRWFS